LTFDYKLIFNALNLKLARAGFGCFGERLRHFWLVLSRWFFKSTGRSGTTEKNWRTDGRTNELARC